MKLTSFLANMSPLLSIGTLANLDLTVLECDSDNLTRD